jgi:hypothetical protein
VRGAHLGRAWTVSAVQAGRHGNRSNRPTNRQPGPGPSHQSQFHPRHPHLSQHHPTQHHLSQPLHHYLSPPLSSTGRLCVPPPCLCPHLPLITQSAFQSLLSISLCLLVCLGIVLNPSPLLSFSVNLANPGGTPLSVLCSDLACLTLLKFLTLMSRNIASYA